MRRDNLLDEHTVMGAFDAVVMLAGDPDRTATGLVQLADQAAETFHAGLTSSLITTGCCHHTLDLFPGRTEAQCLRDLLIERDVPSSNLFTEERSADLLGRIHYVQQQLLLPCSWHHVLLLCPGAHSQTLQGIIESCFDKAFSIYWPDTCLEPSQNQQLDLDALAQLPGNRVFDSSRLAAELKPVKARGLPTSLTDHPTF